MVKVIANKAEFDELVSTLWDAVLELQLRWAILGG